MKICRALRKVYPRFQLTAYIIGLCVVACPPVATAATFELLQQQRFELPTVQSDPKASIDLLNAAPSTKGGFVLSGSLGKSRAWTMHIGRNLAVDWTNVVDQGWPAFGARTVRDARDGGFWVVGYEEQKDPRNEIREHREPFGWLKVTQAHTSDYVARFDAAGNLLWSRSYFSGAARGFYCIVESADAILVTGDERVSVIPDGNTHRYELERVLFVPWLAKLDKQGNLLWERRVVMTGGDSVLTSDILLRPRCTGLSVSENGNVTMAAVVAEVQGARHADDGIHVPANGEHLTARSTIIAQFDSTGRELNKLKLDGENQAFLFEDEGGFSVVGHVRPSFDPGQVDLRNFATTLAKRAREIQAQSGVRITHFDKVLRATNDEVISVPSLSFNLSAVLPEPNGRYLIAGCDDNSNNSIARIASDGSIDAIQKIEALGGLRQCGTIAFGHGGADNEFLLFVSSRVAGDYVASVRTHR
ncbi:hypothetical protein [Paraburkholderia tagetis]|uniref:Two component regulator propeller n=1 Tax=Paraburkholderia tagetis TaxID=2913261 RepID=A0A9X1ULZ4_9BURK|nr:hypothetical protein [Paraburkholderia tagetis]MCG5077833.1 hypothetical protein [Paraburkholderia tagetis]